MLNKILFLSLFVLVSCGRDVKLDTSKMESYTALTDSDSLKVDQDGTLIRGSTDSISTTGGTYSVSKYSSQIALSFIAAQPTDAQVPVRYKGTIKSKELILELLEAR